MAGNFDTHVGLHVSTEMLERVDKEVLRRMQRGASPQGDNDAANRSAVVRDALAEYLRRQELTA